MDELTQEELNGLSPRARKAYEDSNTVLSEITTENPNIEDVVKEEKPKKKKEYKNEEL
tara:strand:- start:342 stop:515 length:174 start_codon:yes stop_codon:yes gene_type:complete